MPFIISKRLVYFTVCVTWTIQINNVCVNFSYFPSFYDQVFNVDDYYSAIMLILLISN